MIEPVLFVPDTHAPYHDQRAWRVMLKAARALRPKIVVHLGDLADCYKVSSHSKDPARQLSFEGEMSVCKQLRGQLDDLGARRKVFIEGNHEDRLRRYLADQAPELAHTVSMDKELALTDNGWEYVTYRDYARLGKLYLTHDTGQGGKYTTARALETFQHSVVIGHHHCIQMFVEGNAAGDQQVAAQFGWLGDIDQVDYLHKVKVQRHWALGFGVGWHDTTTELVYVQPVPIVNYTACLGGKVYRA